MKYIHNIHHRKSIRLKKYDYSNAGFYFLTICTHNREQLFGEIIDGVKVLNEFGVIANAELLQSGIIRKEITIDYYCIMPNHIHLIVIIDNLNNVGANGRSPLRMAPKSLSSFVSGFKSAATNRININRNSPGVPVWQRNYYEHIIRNDRELFEIRKYIENNSVNWVNDEYH